MTYLVNDNDLTAIASAIREKGGTTASLAFPSGFTSAIAAIETGGGGITIDDIATGEAFSGAIVGSSASFIASYAFYHCSNLTTASFPAATSIGYNAFGYCSSLTTASFPVATSIGSYTFGYCSSLAAVSFPAVTSISNYAFAYCYSLTAVSFPAATSIGGNAFAYCSNLTTASFTSTVNLIGSYAFRSCYRLVSLYLTGVSKVPTLSASAFVSTPIGGYSTYAGRYGSVYVPSSLLASFKTAANWSSISARLVGV